MNRTGYILTILLFLTGLIAFAEKTIPTKCEESKVKALIDLKKEKIMLLFQGGIVPLQFEGQDLIEQKYKLKLVDLGCVVPKDICIAHYNAEVAKYLDRKFGKAWRKEVRAFVER